MLEIRKEKQSIRTVYNIYKDNFLIASYITLNEAEAKYKELIWSE